MKKNREVIILIIAILLQLMEILFIKKDWVDYDSVNYYFKLPSLLLLGYLIQINLKENK